MSEYFAKREFMERVSALIGSGCDAGRLTKRLIKEGYHREMIPRALDGVGVTINEGRATIKPRPRQTRLK